MSVTARQVTAVMRGLLPQVQPLRTATLTSSNGLLLGYEITLPETAARNIGGSTRLDDLVWLGGYLTGKLGQQVYVHDVYATRRRDLSKMAHLIVKTGHRP